MRIMSLLILLLPLTLIPAGAQERSYYPETSTLPACSGPDDVIELGCGVTECVGYGIPGEWGDEIQVVFVLPTPPHGGPWLIDHVAFFMSGSGEHHVIVRTPGAPGAPQGVVDEAVAFTSAYATWPPADYTYVPLAGTMPPYPAHLVLSGGASFCVGIRLVGDDALGLVSSGAAGGQAWTSFGSQWYSDSDGLGMNPAVRLGLIDLGSSGAEAQNWGIIKGLFR